MARNYIAILILLATTFLGCKQETCTVGCGTITVSYVAVGFTKAELDSVIVTKYDSYYRPQNTDTILSSAWRYASNNTTNDTLITSGVVFGYENNTKLYIPSVNKTYTISGYTYSGPTSEQLPCHYGGHYGSIPVGPGCGSNNTITYTVNSVLVTTHTANIFITK